jgi:hypothetical protein
MIMTMIFSLKLGYAPYGQLRCKWNGIYLGSLDNLYFKFSNRICSSSENLISEAKNYLQMLDRQGDLTQEQMLSELIYEGEIHRLLKKTYWSISKDAIFYTNVLKKILNSVLKNQRVVWQYGYSLIR